MYPHGTNTKNTVCYMQEESYDRYEVSEGVPLPLRDSNAGWPLLLKVSQLQVYVTDPVIVRPDLNVYLTLTTLDISEAERYNSEALAFWGWVMLASTGILLAAYFCLW